MTHPQLPFALSFEKEQILNLIRHFNRGRIGFDPARKSKSECAEWLLSLRTVEEIEIAAKSLGFTQGKPTPVITFDAKRALSEKEMQSMDELFIKPPIEPPQQSATVSAKSPADAGAQLASLIATLAAGAMDESKVRTIVAEAMRESPVVRHEIARHDSSVYTVPNGSRPELLTAIKRAGIGLHLLFVGPAGSGKTYMAAQVAEALGREFASISCTAGMSESKLEGWLIPDEGGGFVYLPSDFVRLYETGGVFLFDEGDAADPNTLLIVNQALANGGFHLPQRRGNTFVKRHENFVCIMACNTFGTGANMQYAGRSRLDASTLDRFCMGVIPVGYDSGLESALAEPSVLAWARSVRKGIEESKLQRVMSTRTILDASKAVRAEVMTLEEVKETYFQGWKPEERSKVGA